MRQFKVGDRISFTFDFGDTIYGTVVDVSDGEMRVHYLGKSKYDEYNFEHHDNIEDTRIRLLTKLELALA